MTNTNQENTRVATFPIATYKTKDIVWTLGFIAAAIVLPALLAHTPQSQWITGSVVNAILFLAVWRVGLANAALAAALPSSVALMHGLLPAPMAILIPYIILSNVILIAAFFWQKKYPLTGIVTASFLKFAFLFAVTSNFFNVATPLLAMMQWPQFFTALAGGLIAVGIMKYSGFKS